MSLPEPSPTSTALVTGASSGIGREFARQLAELGHNVILVARREERLRELAAELADRHGVRAEPVAADLSQEAGCDHVIETAERIGLDVDILVNNAGFGIYAPFAAEGPEREFQQLGVLIGAVVHLNAHVLPRMLERDRGAIINVSSTAGFQPLPGNGTYAASKAFVLLHSEALAEEVRRTGVTVTAVCPGPVRTEFQETSDPLFADRIPKAVWSTPERVARDGLRAAQKGRRSVIPGGFAVRAFFGPNRMAPSAIALPVARRLMSKELARPREPGALPAGRA